MAATLWEMMAQGDAADLKSPTTPEDRRRALLAKFAGGEKADIADLAGLMVKKKKPGDLEEEEKTPLDSLRTAFGKGPDWWNR